MQLHTNPARKSTQRDELYTNIKFVNEFLNPLLVAGQIFRWWCHGILLL